MLKDMAMKVMDTALILEPSLASRSIPGYVGVGNGNSDILNLSTKHRVEGPKAVDVIRTEKTD